MSKWLYIFALRFPFCRCPFFLGAPPPPTLEVARPPLQGSIPIKQMYALLIWCPLHRRHHFVFTSIFVYFVQSHTRYAIDHASRWRIRIRQVIDATSHHNTSPLLYRSYSCLLHHLLYIPHYHIQFSFSSINLFRKLICLYRFRFLLVILIILENMQSFKVSPPDHIEISKNASGG